MALREVLVIRLGGVDLLKSRGHLRLLLRVVVCRRDRRGRLPPRIGVVRERVLGWVAVWMRRHDVLGVELRLRGGGAAG